jgi:hypothetical protein
MLLRAWPWLLLSMVSFGVANSLPQQAEFSVHNPSMFHAQTAPLVELTH